MTVPAAEATPSPGSTRALAFAGERAVLVSADGEIETLERRDARSLLGAEALLLCNLAFVSRRLDAPPVPRSHYDLLELFAFVLPARSAAPSPRGLARALGLAPPRTLEDEAVLLHEAAGLLLRTMRETGPEDRPHAIRLAWTMGRAGWPWAQPVLRALGAEAWPEGRGDGFDIWNRLAEWEDKPPPGRPGSTGVAPSAAVARLLDLTAAGEERPGQIEFAAAAAEAFAPRLHPGEPRLVLAEAGTGTGKTLGYLAPASLWAEANGPGTWISTYTRNLQRQIDSELARLFPDPAERAEKAVIRKGRENYLCLLNYEEQLTPARSLMGRETVLMGLVARWALASRDGAMGGGDFPGFLASLGLLARLTDQRNECLYAACRHYKRCFVEKAKRASWQAPLVIANHALVMALAAGEGADEGAHEGVGEAVGGSTDSAAPATTAVRVRYVFDEGHHLFHAADSAFAMALTGRETAELRRWLRGPEGARRRGRGLLERLGDLADDEETRHALDEALAAAGALASEGWMGRIAGAAPRGTAETFLAAVRLQVLARETALDSPYGLECAVQPLNPGVAESGAALDQALARLEAPLQRLIARLQQRLAREAENLELGIRLRLDAMARSVARRAAVLPAWRGMLASLGGETPGAFVDWFALARDDGRDVDCGYLRHWLDPMAPFAETVLKPAHGALVASATLRDTAADPESWERAAERTGAAQCGAPAIMRAFPSPFDYAAQTRVYIVGDVAKDAVDARAAAYRALFLASGGGAIGLFTSIATLRRVARILQPAIEAAGLPFYAQHVDAMDAGQLVDVFRAEEDAVLLGTDAVRDGIDVPGRALRLIVFDRVPWPRPGILHRARKAAAGGRDYEEGLTRLKLRQAFGRLVRRADDRGVFVILDRQTPSRLVPAFPEGAAVVRCGLAEAVAETRAFLAPGG